VPRPEIESRSQSLEILINQSRNWHIPKRLSGELADFILLNADSGNLALREWDGPRLVKFNRMHVICMKGNNDNQLFIEKLC
jgi:hypothetical protein